MRTITLAIKDLTQIAKDWKSLLFLVLLPIFFTLFMGTAFVSVEKDPRVPVGIVNGDPGGQLSAALEDWLAASELVRPVPLEGEAAGQVNKLVNEEKILAALIIPPGFSEGTLSGQMNPPAILIPDGSLAGKTAGTYLQTGSKRLMGAVQAARLSTETSEAIQPFSGEAERKAYFEAAASAAFSAWEQPPLGVAVERATHLPGNRGQVVASGFHQASPGMVVQFAVFSLITSAMVLVLERKSGTLQRLLTAPVTRPQVIGGHLLAMFLVSFLQQALLVALGQLFFQVDYLREPLGTLLLVAGLSLFVASLGLLIGALARSEEHVILGSLIAMFTLSPLAGAWFPLELTGKTFTAIAHLTPTAWAMDGFQNIVLRGLGLSSVLIPVGFLAAFALFFFGLAVWRFKFE